ncbi:MAG: hypothetical protein IJK53_11715 [Erysipelotrichaceae bacterium]|nr:hypothetical protein [Erysipelotrichaceae bacterium]
MIEKLIEEFAQSYTFDAIENKEFDSFKVNGMDFEVKAYDAQFLGRVSSMKGKMKFGLMKMETLIVNPLELDVPLFSLDLIQVPGKLIVILEQYDTLVNAKRNESVFLNIKEKYEYLEDHPSKSAWYDELRYSSSIGKKVSKKKADRVKEMIEEYFEAYLDLCRDARVIEKEEKKVKADLYRDGLLENGGASTDSFLKAWGKEKTERFFKEVLFG